MTEKASIQTAEIDNSPIIARKGFLDFLRNDFVKVAVYKDGVRIFDNGVSQVNPEVDTITSDLMQSPDAVSHSAVGTVTKDNEEPKEYHYSFQKTQNLEKEALVVVVEVDRAAENQSLLLHAERDAFLEIATGNGYSHDFRTPLAIVNNQAYLLPRIADRDAVDLNMITDEQNGTTLGQNMQEVVDLINKLISAQDVDLEAFNRVAAVPELPKVQTGFDHQLTVDVGIDFLDLGTKLKDSGFWSEFAVMPSLSPIYQEAYTRKANEITDTVARIFNDGNFVLENVASYTLGEFEQLINTREDFIIYINAVCRSRATLTKNEFNRKASAAKPLDEDYDPGFVVPADRLEQQPQPVSIQDLLYEIHQKTQALKDLVNPDRERVLNISTDKCLDLLIRQTGLVLNHLERIQLYRSLTDESLQKESVSFEQFVHMIDELNTAYSTPDQTIDVEISNAGDGRDLNIEPGLVRTAIAELVNNAMLFADEMKSVIVTVSKEGEEMIIEVLSSGSPISSRDRHLIVSPGFQAGNSSREGGRIGLGLAITDRIATLHGGSLRYDSIVSRSGTYNQFTLVLPVAA